MAKSTLATVQSLRASLASARRANQETEDRAIGVAVGHLGGALGAAMKKYIPAIIPGDAADHPAVLVASLALDVAAVMADDTWPTYLAAGVGGYLTGTATEKILP